MNVLSFPDNARKNKTAQRVNCRIIQDAEEFNNFFSSSRFQTINNQLNPIRGVGISEVIKELFLKKDL